MPRRKQQAPRRAAAYVCHELKAAALAGEAADAEEGAADGEPPAKFACAETEPGRAGGGFQDSPAADFSGHDPDSESHVSEASDRMADFEGGSVKNEEEAKAAAPAGEAGAADSLEQMKAVYNNFLSKSYWSSLSLHLHAPPADKHGGGGSSSSSSSSCGSGSFDWHQSAVAKTLQQVSQGRALPEPSLFSTVQLYRQSSKLYGSIFTGASKFRCKDCSAAYDTLVQLTVHMNETGHYRDDNHEADDNNPRRWSKPRKRSLLEMEGKEDAQKVLKCMYCGHSFESLQDLSVHMIKTKHYQKVPLKEPVTPVAAKVLPAAARKRAPLDLELPSSPDSSGGTPKAALSDSGDPLQKNPNPYITPNNRYGHQNGASYAWHFEARKSQILKCMECGSSHDSLQELTAHMMVTGHFIKVTNSAMKKGKPIMDTPVTPAVTTLLDEKVQSVPLAATTFTSPAHTPASVSPKLTVEVKKEEDKDKARPDEKPKDKDKDKACEEEEKYDISSKYHYLTENDLEESPKGGLDILKSLENTVTSAINKAQNGTPSWGGYPSIHAAYQLPNMMKLSLGSSGKSAPLKPVFGNSEILSPTKSQSLVSPPSSQTSPMPKTNFHAMEELVKKVAEKAAKVDEPKELDAAPSPPKRATPSPCGSDGSEALRMDACGDGGCRGQEDSPGPPRGGGRESSPPAEPAESGPEPSKPVAGGLSSSTAIITDHPPEQPFVNPLSALQSVMNIHLGKAAKPSLPALDPMSMLFKMSNSLAEKAAVAGAPPLPPRRAGPLDRPFHHASNDQPMDLTKGKGEKGCAAGPALLSPAPTSPAASSSAAKAAAVVSFLSSSPLRENALSDISDMLKNLTESHTCKSSTPSSASEKSDADGATLEDAEEATPAQKRKGRQSNWNPQHLLILQAQFAASLRQTAEGKFIMSDLSPQERMHISRFTGLSMTTISHWLANVKYQLRRTGGTKFLKNLDTGHPVFFCNDCASQIRTPSTYINHLESHLGFRLRDLSKLSSEPLSSQLAQTKSPSDKLVTSSPEEDLGTSYQCKLCNRTFASKHAVKLHLSKTHGKSPEDHLLYVSELEKQ